MEQNRTPISEEVIENAIQKMKIKGGYPDAAYKLVREDMELGITREETRMYSEKMQEPRAMRVCSDCLRNGIAKEIIEVICNKSLDAVAMETLYEIAVDGANKEMLEKIIKDTDGKSHQMKKAYDSMKNIAKEDQTKQMEVADALAQEVTSPIQQEQVIDEDSGTKKDPFTGLPSDVMPGYLKELVDNFRAATTKLGEQEQKYEKLNEKLDSYEKNRDEVAIRERMEHEMAEKDTLLAKQQDELQQANAAIARLRREKENMEQEMRTMKNRMQDEIDDLNRKLKNQSMTNAGENQAVNYAASQPSETAVAGSMAKSVSQSMPQTSPQQTMPAGMPQVGIPIYYQMPLIDSSGQIVQRVQVERTEKKTGGVAGILGKLGFAKKSRADIVKLVASGDLVPAQLVQIKVAIEKGLTEGQLVELINNNVSAEKMKEIIEIAVLENSMS